MTALRLLLAIVAVAVFYFLLPSGLDSLYTTTPKAMVEAGNTLGLAVVFAAVILGLLRYRN